jgi:spore maturation protein CgeB
MTPPKRSLRIVAIGLSIGSSWGNGHATTYRGLLGALASRGASVLFLERDVPWYCSHRDYFGEPGLTVKFYSSLANLKRRFRSAIRDADVVMVGSYVPEGIDVGDWVQREAKGLVAFYDIDTPITLAALEADRCEYLSRRLLPGYGLYLSFTGGPTLTRLEALGARCVRPLYCAVDPDLHRPVPCAIAWDVGYLGTYAADRQPALDQLLLTVARRRPQARFVVAGAQYPAEIGWPKNVDHMEHIGPAEHSAFYLRQRFTLNVTRAEMRRLGYSPSVRLFEAAACGAAIISDVWPGLEEILTPGREVLTARSHRDIEEYLMLPDDMRTALGQRARARVLSAHTSAHRAIEFEDHVADVTRSVTDPEPIGDRVPGLGARGLSRT